jgi:hypothetical protein
LQGRHVGARKGNDAVLDSILRRVGRVD